MRKIVFSLLWVLGVAGSLSAQAPTDRMRPVAGDMGLGFKLTGIADVSFSHWKSDQLATPQLLYRYYVNDRFAVRAGLGLNIGSQKGTYYAEIAPPQGSTIKTVMDRDSSISTTKFSIDPGIEYHLTSPASKVDPYVGFVASIGYEGNTQKQVKDKVTTFDLSTSSTTPTFIQDATVTSRLAGGMAFGGDIVAGFNYFFSDNFALGAEYMLGYHMLNRGGDNEITSVTLSGAPNSINRTENTQRFKSTSSNGNASVRSTGGVNISVFW